MSDTLRGLFASDAVSRHFDDPALLAAMARFGPAASVAGVSAGADARADGSTHGAQPAGTLAPVDADADAMINGTLAR